MYTAMNNTLPLKNTAPQKISLCRITIALLYGFLLGLLNNMIAIVIPTGTFIAIGSSQLVHRKESFSFKVVYPNISCFSLLSSTSNRNGIFYAKVRSSQLVHRKESFSFKIVYTNISRFSLLSSLFFLLLLDTQH